MSRLGSFSQLNQIAKRAQRQFSIDLGSTFTKIFLEGQLVWHQPTLVAWQSKHQFVVAVGEAAAQLVGKSSRGIQLHFPVKKGVIADMSMARMYVETVLKTVYERQTVRSWLSPRCSIAAPAGATPVELKQLRYVIEQAGLTIDGITPKPLAAMHSIMGGTQKVIGLIDIGGQTVEVGLFASGEPVMMTTLSGYGGERYTELIQEYAKLEKQCEISWQVAEKIKRQIGVVALAVNPANTPVIVVRGRDTRTGAMATIKLSGAELAPALLKVLEEMLSELRLVFADVSAEIVTPVFEQGLWLCGGGSQLSGMDEVISEELQTTCSIVAEPEQAVASGLQVK